MNLILRVLKPFGLHDDHEVGEFVPAPLKEVNKLVRDGYAEIVINNVGENKLYDEHRIDGELYPTWVTPESLKPLEITPTPYLDNATNDPADLSTNCGICNHKMNISHCALHKMEKDGTLTSYHMHHEGQLKDLKPCEDCGHHRLLCGECKETD